eukprot:m.295861 g.295861  ORF g.295861 m.295861 type:complete len:734 (-) comp19517_c0_seq7:303-2504(-)
MRKFLKMGSGMSKAEKKACQARLESQLWEAENSPAPTADLSACALDQIPARVFAAVMTMQKQGLILRSNQIVQVSSALAGCTSLRVLDLHDNHLSSLPDSLKQLKHLQVLQLSNNRFREFPGCIIGLRALQTLDLHGNTIHVVPDEVRELKSLRALNVGQNPVEKLPVGLAFCRALESLNVEGTELSYPAKAVIAQGVVAIMQTLCADAGIAYEPPSQHVLTVLDQDVPASQDVAALAARREQEDLQSLMQHQSQTSNQAWQQQQILFKQEQDAIEQRRAMALQAQQDNRQLMDRITDEERQHEAYVHLNHEALRKEQQQMFESFKSLCVEEDRLARAQVDQFERIRLDPSQLAALVSNQDEAEAALLEQALQQRAAQEAAMQSLQQETAALGQLSASQAVAKDQLRDLALAQVQAYESSFNEHMMQRYEDLDRAREAAAVNMETDDSLLRQAVEAATERDQALADLATQMADLEAQLVDLNMRDRAAAADRGTAALDSERARVVVQLATLAEEYRKGDEQRIISLNQLEQAEKAHYRNYWLARMDYALQHLQGERSQHDPVVAALLSQIGLDFLVGVFAAHAVDAVVLRALDDTDLQTIGVSRVGDRRRILLAIRDLFTTKDVEGQEGAIKKPGERGGASAAGPAAAAAAEAVVPAPLLDAGASSSLSSSAGNETPSVQPGQTAECVLCLDKSAEVAFLKCGHLCSCLPCSEKLAACPMCRAPIESRLRVYT